MITKKDWCTPKQAIMGRKPHLSLEMVELVRRVSELKRWNTRLNLPTWEQIANMLEVSVATLDNVRNGKFEKHYDQAYIKRVEAHAKHK